MFDPPRELLADLADRWRLTLGRPLAHDGVLAWVARVRRGDERYVLKINPPPDDPRDEARDEAAGLEFWDGDGAVRLEAAEHIDGHTALLLEDCVPGTPLTSAPGERQDEVLADLLRRLWRDPPAATFRPLSEMCDWWAGSAQETIPHEFADVPDLFRALGRTDRNTLLATDLHAGNVLQAEREPWLAIDPKPYVGDRHYDVTQHLLNDPDRLRGDPITWIERMADLLDLDTGRLTRWMYARCVIHHSQTPGHPWLLRVARRLR